MNKYIVTGGAGFIGSHLVEALLNDGCEVVVVDDLSTGFASYIPKHPNITLIQVDITDWEALTKNFAYFKGADGIFHLAACARIQPSIYDPSRTHDVNITGTFNILEMMRMLDIKKIVYSASSSSYGLKNISPLKETMPPDNLNPYALTKYVGEQYCKTWGKLYGMKNVCLKYFNVYGRRSPLEGPYAPVIGLFFRQALKENTQMTIVGDGNQKRDFTHVGDVVNANRLAMRKCLEESVNGETINVGTGKNYTVNEIAEITLKTLGKYGHGKTYIHSRPGESRETLADISQAKKLLGWTPTVTLEDGIRDLFGFYLDNLIRE